MNDLISNETDWQGCDHQETHWYHQETRWKDNRNDNQSTGKI